MTTRTSLQFNPPVFLRIGPNGFLWQGNLYPSIHARILTPSTVRKRFVNGALVCSSSDAHRSRHGTNCDACPHLPHCMPRVRLRLRPLSYDLPDIVFIELSFSSAKNFLDYFATLQDQGLDPLLVPVHISVLNQGRWAEISFQPLQANLP